MARYSKGSQKTVGKALHEMKRGELTIGKKGGKVRSRKQAIAIGLSEARKKGEKVPIPGGSRKSSASAPFRARQKTTAPRRKKVTKARLP